MTRTYSGLLDVMVGAAWAAAEKIRDGATRRAALTWEAKGPVDYVSEVDRGAQDAVLERLGREFPEAMVLGEEGWDGEPVGRGLWFVVDPLDGTTNFLHGVTEYAVSIGALEDGVPVAGVVLNAAHGVLYTATRGGGAFRDGELVRVSPITEPAKALIATGFPFKATAYLDRYAEQFKAVARKTAGVRRAGAAALDLANVASGRYEAFWELELAPWDMAAGILLVREAGGVITDFEGRDAEVCEGSIVAGSPGMHAWLLETVHRADQREG